MQQTNIVNINTQQFKVINELKFLLIILVLFIHSTGFPPLSRANIDLTTVESWDIYHLIRLIIGYIIGQGAVPAFFLISGFLFFWNVEYFNRKTYISKLKRRVRTLLIPYLLWNLLYILLFLIPLCYHSIKTDTITTSLSNFFKENNIFTLLWSNKRGYPANIPLWFVRDLMVMNLVSPIVYLLVKKLKSVFLLFVLCAWLLRGWINLPFVQNVAFCFFSIGAYLSIKRHNLIALFWQKRTWIFTLTIILFSVDAYQIILKKNWPVINALFIFFLIATFFNLTNKWVKSGKAELPQTLTHQVFFIYCAHDLNIITFYDGMMAKILRDVSPWWFIVLFLTTPAVKIILCMIYRRLMVCCMPKFLKLLEGGRSSL